MQIMHNATQTEDFKCKKIVKDKKIIKVTSIMAWNFFSTFFVYYGLLLIMPQILSEESKLSWK